ncbi:MAG: SPOR domain-containing protein [Anaerovoracaceae bacterium]
MRNKRYAKNFRGNARGNGRRRVKPNYMPVIIILCLSVGCGYATAKYVVEPVVNYVPQVTEKLSDKQDEKSKKDSSDSSKDKESKVVEDDVKVESSGKLTGYALQFGSYSSKDAAEKAMSALNITGLQVKEQNSMYKIVGETYKTKDEARSALDKLPEGTKAFVTEIYE